jgi:hypothetical protein
MRLQGVFRLEFLHLLHSMVIFFYWHTCAPLSYCRSSLHNYRGAVEMYNLDRILWLFVVLGNTYATFSCADS